MYENNHAGIHQSFSANGYNQCAAYCRDTVSWHYGREVNFEDSRCPNDSPPCTIRSTKSVAVQNTYSFTVGIDIGKRNKEEEISEERSEGGLSPSDLHAAFNAGATWSYSTTNTTGTSTSQSRPSYGIDQCGYWTFILYSVT